MTPVEPARMTQAMRREIRDWASTKDASIKSSGTLPHYVIVAWNRAHPDRQVYEIAGRLSDDYARRVRP